MQHLAKILVFAVLVSVGSAYGQTSDLPGGEPQKPAIAQEQPASGDASVAPVRAGMTPFMNAACDADLATIEALIKEGADVNYCPAGHWSPLMLAVMDNPNPEVVYALIKAGADVNAKDGNGCNAVFHAAMSNRHPEVINALIKAGGDFKCQDISSATPLIVAAGYSIEPEVVKALIQAGSDLNARSKEGWFPLMCAAIGGSSKNVSTLLEAGADINAINELTGQTALMAAATSAFSAPEKILLLLNAGARVDLQDKSGKTALDHARGNEGLQETDAMVALEEATKRQVAP